MPEKLPGIVPSNWEIFIGIIVAAWVTMTGTIAHLYTITVKKDTCNECKKHTQDIIIRVEKNSDEIKDDVKKLTTLVTDHILQRQEGGRRITDR